MKEMEGEREDKNKRIVDAYESHCSVAEKKNVEGEI